MSARTNWAGNITFNATQCVNVTSVAELQTIVARTPVIRALGTGHSFNRMADTTAVQVSLLSLPRTLDLDEEARTVTVDGGSRYGDFMAELHARGWALPNTGSLPHISVAGAVATGTHGSGVRNRSLSAAVAALQLVTADGDLVTLRREDPDFDGAVVSLGRLGVVTAVTLDIVPTYDVRQWVYEDLPWEQAIGNLADILGKAYSVSMFTDWRTGTFQQVWVKERMADVTGDAAQEWLGATLARSAHDPIPSMSPVNCTQQGGVPGPWHERLPHFRLEFTPSHGDEVQAEYFLPREHAVAALTEVRKLGHLLAPVLMVSEIRTIAADDLWLSPASGRDTVALHLTLVKDEAAVTPVVSELESVLSAYDARPHWGKVFCCDPQTVAALYPRMSDFAALVKRWDPTGKFANDLTRAYVG